MDDERSSALTLETVDILPPLTDEEFSSNPDDQVNSLNAPIEVEPGGAADLYRLSVELPVTIQEAMVENNLILENEVTEETQQEIPSQAQDPVNTISCNSNDLGCFEKITLGENEKEQLKNVGLNLLRIGRQLLEEMNFMENLVASFGGRSRQGSLEDAEHIRKDIESNVDKLASHAQRLSWIQHKAEEYKETRKVAQFGSAFGTPNGSTSTNRMENPFLGPQGKQFIQQNEPFPTAVSNDFEKRMALMETKVDGLMCKVETFEKQTINAHHQVQGLINRIFEDIADLRNTILQNNSQAQSVCNGVNEKINVVEQQIVQLAQTLWELQCMTKVQMHFGKET